MVTFDYGEAFQRNIGLLTEEEQKRLKTFTIAIPGMGGVGSAHLISLVRQGFTRFKIADPDSYEIKNFNRQYGADLKTVGQNKAHVMKKKALAINPKLKIEIFPKGITPSNLNTFLERVDLVIDGLDFFEIDMRRALCNTSLKKNIPFVTAGPIGFSVAFLIFLPKGPNFDHYFNVDDSTPYEKKLISFAAGLAPKMLQRKYMRDVNLKEKKGPSSIAAVNACAAVTTVQAIKICLGKKPIKAVPYFHQFDMMVDKYVVGKIPFGNKNPLQRLKVSIGLRMVQKNAK